MKDRRTKEKILRMAEISVHFISWDLFVAMLAKKDARMTSKKQSLLTSKDRQQLIMQAAKHIPANELGPSSSSSLAAFYTPPFSLQLASALPAQPFVNHALPIRLLLVDSLGQIVRGQRIPLDVLLVQAGAGVGSADSSTASQIKSLYTCSPSDVCVTSEGEVEFSLTFLPSTMSHSQRIFLLKVFFTPDGYGMLNVQDSKAPNATQSAHSSQLLLYASKPLSVVRQKLSVTSDLRVRNSRISSHMDFDFNNSDLNASNSADCSVWYKDEGGREHGIEICVCLVNELGEMVFGEQVPIRVELCYLSGEVCTKPNMYTIIDIHNAHVHSTNTPTQPSLYIHKDTGLCKFKVRIQDISKNHQRQLFKIRIVPDIYRGAVYGDIGGGETEGIEVKSKRTKRHRGEATGGAGAGAGYGMGNNFPSHPQQAHSNVHSHTPFLPASSSHPAIASIPTNYPHVQHPASSSALHYGISNGRGGDNIFGLLTNQSALSHPTTLSDEDDAPPPPKKTKDTSHNHSARPSSNGNSSHNNHVASQPSASSLLDVLIRFTTLTYETLPSLKWTPLGYPPLASNPSQPDLTTQPLYLIPPNPTTHIEHLLKVYEQEVAPLLPGSQLPSSHQQPQLSQSSARRGRGHSLSDESLLHTVFHFPSGQADGRGRRGNEADERASVSAKEEEVHFILSLPYHTLFPPAHPLPPLPPHLFPSNIVPPPAPTPDAPPLLFPAFDKLGKLTGFYMEVTDTRMATIIVFLDPDAQTYRNLGIKEKLIEDVFGVGMHSGSVSIGELQKKGLAPHVTPDSIQQSIHVRKDTDSGGAGTLDSLKQDALVHFWLSQVAFDDF